MVKSFFVVINVIKKKYFFGSFGDLIDFHVDLAAPAQQHQQLQNHLDKYRHKWLASDVLVICIKCLHYGESPSLESVHTARKLHIWTTLKTLPHWSNKLFPQHLLVLWQKEKKKHTYKHHLWVLVWKTWTMFTLMDCFLVSHRPYSSCDTREKSSNQANTPGHCRNTLARHGLTGWPALYVNTIPLHSSHWSSLLMLLKTYICINFSISR